MKGLKNLIKYCVKIDNLEIKLYLIIVKNKIGSTIINNLIFNKKGTILVENVGKLFIILDVKKKDITISFYQINFLTKIKKTKKMIGLAQFVKKK